VAAPAPPLAEAQADDSSRQFVEGLYGRGPAGQAAMTTAIDCDALLDRVLSGLSSSPSAEWRRAAAARLEERRGALAGAISRSVAGSLSTRVLPAQPGADGSTRVAVRLYVISQQAGLQTGWHRLTLRRAGSLWRVAEIEMLDSGDQLSNLAMSAILDPEREPLPEGSAARVLSAPSIKALASLIAGIVMGLVLRAALARRRTAAASGGEGGGAGSGFVWGGAALGALFAFVFFAAGMMDLFSQRGAIDELKQRAASFARLQEGKVDAALSIWRENRMAQTIRAGVLASQGNLAEAEAYLEALAQTSNPSPTVHLQLARLQEQSKRWAQAAASRARFAELVGGDALIYTEAARDRAMAQDARGAEELLSLAGRSEPPDFRILMVRAETHAAMKKGAAVAADIRALLASPEGVLNAREAAALLEQGEEYKPVRNDPAIRAFLKELKAGGDETPIGPVRR